MTAWQIIIDIFGVVGIITTGLGIVVAIVAIRVANNSGKPKKKKSTRPQGGRYGYQPRMNHIEGNKERKPPKCSGDVSQPSSMKMCESKCGKCRYFFSTSCLQKSDRETTTLSYRGWCIKIDKEVEVVEYCSEWEK